MEPLLCPACKTNRTRFNLIAQQVKQVKLNPQSGSVEQEFAEDAGPFHMSYQGPDYRVQCAVCGLNENMDMFVKMAQVHKQ
ncbi:DNA alkylation repair protein [Ectobacillus sp. JY-23]|uniref:DNA alkylation repair protein n=1 Tax=Ectobacillus sp. JY-23 TaxID=2933872 RepID=UPI001FF3B7A4|nr:DNA alkylation repair protein [Ectobacillus sp. JY-23]UOY93043.1 DNA alkylation repair protein [Ectobacillus sp. JY-23]